MLLDSPRQTKISDAFQSSSSQGNMDCYRETENVRHVLRSVSWVQVCFCLIQMIPIVPQTVVKQTCTSLKLFWEKRWFYSLLPYERHGIGIPLKYLCLIHFCVWIYVNEIIHAREQLR